MSRNGDLITNAVLEVELPTLNNGWKWNNNVGHNLIEEVELEIGGQRIDRHYGEWLDIWSELSTSEAKKGMFDSDMIRRRLAMRLRAMGLPSTSPFSSSSTVTTVLLSPSSPFNTTKSRSTSPSPSSPICATTPMLLRLSRRLKTPMSLYIDYVYLDTDERKRFAQSQHELLIEQLQFTGDETPMANGSYRLNFNHPVKELVWVVTQPKDGDKFNYDKVGIDDVVTSANLQLNGHDRFDERKGSYFRLVQPFQHHTRIPEKNIYVYSFAVKPEEHQPSGTCDFSRIDNATLKLKIDSGAAAVVGSKVKIFATSVNVLRILSGMGGLAYSN